MVLHLDDLLEFAIQFGELVVDLLLDSLVDVPVGDEAVPRVERGQEGAVRTERVVALRAEIAQGQLVRRTQLALLASPALAANLVGDGPREEYDGLGLQKVLLSDPGAAGRTLLPQRGDHAQQAGVAEGLPAAGTEARLFCGLVALVAGDVGTLEIAASDCLHL